jgi:hypothetical protein
VNPFVELEVAEKTGVIPSSIVKKIRRRIKYIEEGVTKVEKASGLSYPKYYIEPVLMLSTSSVDVGQVGVIYAKTSPVNTVTGLEIIVQLSTPLATYGLKQTITAVLAHEFTHYVELVRKFNKLEIFSDSTTSSLFESVYSDHEKTIKPETIFKDRRLIKTLIKKFPNGLDDSKLDEKTMKYWIEKGMPTKQISTDTSSTRIPVSSILTLKVDPLLKMKIQELEKKEYGKFISR